jgi:hypothetical protein
VARLWHGPELILPKLALQGKTTVGVTGFEPATSSSRTKRATKLRHTPWLHQASVSLAHSLSPARAVSTGQLGELCRDYAAEVSTLLLVNVSSVASGGQAKRIGAKGDVPTPADTCIHAVRPFTLC